MEPARLAENSRESDTCQRSGSFLNCGQISEEPGSNARQTRGRVSWILHVNNPPSQSRKGQSWMVIPVVTEMK